MTPTRLGGHSSCGALKQRAIRAVLRLTQARSRLERYYLHAKLGAVFAD
jgi:hypothetical protein